MPQGKQSICNTVMHIGKLQEQEIVAYGEEELYRKGVFSEV